MTFSSILVIFNFEIQPLLASNFGYIKFSRMYECSFQSNIHHFSNDLCLKVQRLSNKNNRSTTKRRQYFGTPCMFGERIWRSVLRTSKDEVPNLRIWGSRILLQTNFNMLANLILSGFFHNENSFCQIFSQKPTDRFISSLITNFRNIVCKSECKMLNFNPVRVFSEYSLNTV